MTAKDILQDYATTYLAYRQFFNSGIVVDKEYETKTVQLGVDTLLHLMKAGYDQDVAMKMILRAQKEAPEMENMYQGVNYN